MSDSECYLVKSQVTYFEYGERVALPLEEAGNKLHQVAEGAAGKS